MYLVTHSFTLLSEKKIIITKGRERRYVVMHGLNFYSILFIFCIVIVIINYHAATYSLFLIFSKEIEIVLTSLADILKGYVMNAAGIELWLHFVDHRGDELQTR